MHDMNGHCCSRVNRWRITDFCGFGLEHVVYPYSSFFNFDHWMQISHDNVMITVHHIFQFSNTLTWIIMSIYVFKRPSNHEALPERGESLMSKRSSLKREHHFLAVLSPIKLSPIHGASVSGYLHCFCPSIEFKEKNMSEMFQFLHLSIHYLASTTPLTIFKWQNFNM